MLLLSTLNRMRGEGKGVKEVRGRKAIWSHDREMIMGVCSFMKRKADSGMVIGGNRLQNGDCWAADVTE
jgi:hypothetical protein